VLPGAGERDPERRERFEREAQTIAALNHPNIVTIHAIEHTGETAFLAMNWSRAGRSPSSSPAAACGSIS
jgi:serine/threonine protein kinase